MDDDDDAAASSAAARSVLNLVQVSALARGARLR